MFICRNDTSLFEGINIDICGSLYSRNKKTEKSNKLKIGSLIARQHINESRLRVLLELIK